MNNKPMTIFGDGKQKRAFSYIDDILEPLWKTGVQKNCSMEIINLGGTKYYTVNEANRILISVVGDGERIYEQERHEVRNAHPTWKKSVELLNYKDLHTLEDGAKRITKCL
jgi:UDP-glucose 4-epimerase